MLLYVYKISVHWYFRSAVKTADNRDIGQNITLSRKCETIKLKH